MVAISNPDAVPVGALVLSFLELLELTLSMDEIETARMSDWVNVVGDTILDAINGPIKKIKIRTKVHDHCRCEGFEGGEDGGFSGWWGLMMYLLPEHVTSCHLRISFSAHTDLNIKFQSHRSSTELDPV
ncbi:hypothetical protein ACLOJK_029185 [Asimina triloba]